MSGSIRQKRGIGIRDRSNGIGGKIEARSVIEKVWFLRELHDDFDLGQGGVGSERVFFSFDDVQVQREFGLDGFEHGRIGKVIGFWV